MKKRSVIQIAFLLVMVLLLSMPAGIGAQEPECTQGACSGDVAGVGAEEVNAEGLGAYRKYALHGGYVAAGVGLRNRGWGTITLTGIPAGATVYKAFLYWNITDYWQKTWHQQGKFKGHSITGTYIGADHEPCWLPDNASSYSYRADVTQYVTGNGKYGLSNFASGRRDGADPWSVAVTPPLIQGASLVVIFQKNWYPWTTIVIWDGAAQTPDTADTLWIRMGGFTATNPVGPAYTTFIGADGQSGAEPASTCNGNAIPEADWDGTDPNPGGNFSQGNLWDTDTASVGRYISPGNTSVTIAVSGGPDCLVWVAQVFSISHGGLDTDGDALLDGWEANGYNGIDLAAMGASPWHKDIFVEHDWMDGPHNHKPSTTVLNNVRNAFGRAWIYNPDGHMGIKLHNDVGQAPYGGGNSVPHQQDISSSCPDSAPATFWAAFDAIKNPNFASARQDIFHYVLWAHDICPAWGSVSGLSRGIPASDLIVSLGSWPSYGTEDARTGTFMHELGHNLGFTHGGNVGDHVNYKPNHLSVMNYAFQVIGIWRNAARRWDYTRMSIYALNENNLNEVAGLGGSASLASYGTRYYCNCDTGTRDDNTADTNVDWNCNSSYQTSVATDINRDCARSTLGQVRNQWANIVYNGGTIGPGVAASRLSAEDVALYPCMRHEDALEILGSK